jgi:aspartate ammonia-lyase
LQPGSSIMPGKINPVIPEVVTSIVYQPAGYDTTVTIAAQQPRVKPGRVHHRLR